MIQVFETTKNKAETKIKKMSQSHYTSVFADLKPPFCEIRSILGPEQFQKHYREL